MSSGASNSLVADKMLGERITAFHAELAKQAPAEVVTTIVGEIAGIVSTGVGSKAPRGGDSAPTFTLKDARGGEISLQKLLGEGPVVLAFYRGQWCPYCDMQLRAYQEVLPRIRALGAHLVAISPQTPDESLSTAEKRNLAFSVLSDVGNKVARSYGLVFKVPAGLDGVHKAFGIDLAKSNGDLSNELPVPGVFVIGRDGRIAFSHVNADYRERLEPAELLRRLEQVAGKH
jgi:peroxiredoxin